MLIQQALLTGRKLLQSHSISSHSLDAQVLLSHVTGLDRTGLLLRGDQVLTAEQQEQYEELLKRRAKGEPVAYLVGCKEFMGLDFRVTSSVLIPRPDTELMVETALEYIKKIGDQPRIAIDVGTGSGAIAVSMAHHVQDIQVHAVDISEAALEVARQNAQHNQVTDRVQFHLGNLLEPINPQLQGQVSVITANLPYVPSGDIPGLMSDVKDFEPHLALDGGPDGLDLYRILIPQAHRFLHPGGLLLTEIGPGQGEAAKRMFAEEQWVAEVRYDLAGRERIVEGRRL